MSISPLSCIIIDDEDDARELLLHYLKSYEHISVLDSCSNVDSAFKSILLHHPDVIFLDIQMPEKNGFQLLEELRHSGIINTPKVLFCTAHDQYAVQAIKFAAFDYLLKPISKEDFNNCIHKLNAISGNIFDKLDCYLHYINPENKIRINTRTGYILINVNEIVYCSAEGNYTDIILGKTKREVATMNLGKTSKLLKNNPQFKRIGRSLLINANYIYKVDRAKKVCVLEKEGNSFSVDIPDKYLGGVIE